MKIKDINQGVRKAAAETGFKIGKEIYRGTYYTEGNLRNIIYDGFYKNKPAVLKFYDDPRITDEAASLKEFLKNNKSVILTAPKLYRSKVLSAHSGWMIVEKIPDSYHKYEIPLDKIEREEFLKIFLEYRKNFSLKPGRKLFLTEKLSSDNFYIFRISRWLELAQNKEADRLMNGKRNLLDEDFLKMLAPALSKIREECKNIKMIWCHGHFKPSEIFTDRARTKYYLTDFAHTAMFPEGYELAFMIWSDYLMADDKWKMPYRHWKKGLDAWIMDVEKIAKELGFNNYKRLIRVSLIERVLGTILADITASDRLEQEKERGISLMTRLLKDLL
ncbi:MAG: hypothetical protein PHG95_00185 [Patescibacteria group bacterium]|nr:hypothetical protein [Patescibacteria group bacterium]